MKGLSGTETETVLYESLVRRGTLTAQYLVTTVPIVTEKRMSDVFHVSPDLMGAACL
jgi:hypothetical protein